MKISQMLRATVFGLVSALLVSGCGGGGDSSSATSSGSGGSTVFVVNTTADLIDDNTSDGICHSVGNICSLRAAIMQTNHRSTPGLTTISVPAGTYTLSLLPTGLNGEESGDLNLATPLGVGQTIAIVGAGAASTTINANGIDGVLKIDTDRVVSISNITVRGGRLQTSSSRILGGGILNDGTLSIADCVIASNKALLGGGIYNSHVLNITRSSFKLNFAEVAGGGLAAAGATTVRSSTFDANESTEIGGGIVTANNVDLIVVNSTLSGNMAGLNGGGIAVVNNGDASTLIALYNTSIVANLADSDSDSTGGLGAGMYVAPGALFRIVNTLIAGNTQGPSNGSADCYGTVQAYGWNLLGNPAACTFGGNGTAATGLVIPNSISPLTDNGGPTWTNALKSTSAAVDSTLALGCVDETGALLTTDQRGAPRVAGARCDVGAFEFGSVAP